MNGAFDKNLHPTMHGRGAETLLEAIVAISIITLLLAPASALYVSSIHTLSANKNNLIASALAEEGTEMMKNFVDTNLLRFSPKVGQCWNTSPSHSDIADCENFPIADGAYRLTLDPDALAWDLIANADYCGIRQDPATSLYFCPPAGMENRGSETIFSRKITVENLDADSDGEADAISAVSSVKYRLGGSAVENKKTIKLSPPQ